MPTHMERTINIGVCNAYFTKQDTDISVWPGITKDGATVSYEADYHEIRADQTGTTLPGEALIGEKVTVTFNLLDTTKKKIAFITPTASVIGNESDPEAVTFGQRPGLRTYDHVGRLTLRPLSAGANDGRDVTIYRTCNTGSLDLSYKIDQEWVIPCEFNGYYDDLRTSGDQLFRIGTGDGETQDFRQIDTFWIAPSNPAAGVGSTVNFSANAVYEDGTAEDVTLRCSWSSASPSIATITAAGVATTVGIGTTAVQATYMGQTGATSLTVE